jgi:hypothetical protein
MHAISSHVRVVAILAAGLALGGAALAAPTGPRLQTLDRTPVVVRGTSFKPAERVTVVLDAAGTWRRTAIADSDGRFTVRFAVQLGACDAFRLQAFGSKGSRARSLPERRTTCDDLPTT